MRLIDQPQEFRNFLNRKFSQMDANSIGGCRGGGAIAFHYANGVPFTIALEMLPALTAGEVVFSVRFRERVVFAIHFDCPAMCAKGVILSSVSASASRATSVSWATCARSQYPLERPKKRHRRRSVSAVMARLLDTISLIRWPARRWILRAGTGTAPWERGTPHGEVRRVLRV